MVAEILAGAALIKASIDAIKGTIASCKDVSEIAKDIDGLFQGQQDIARDKRRAAKTGKSATEIVIAEEQAKIDLKIAQELIIAKFGYHAWQRILQIQADQLRCWYQDQLQMSENLALQQAAHHLVLMVNRQCSKPHCILILQSLLHCWLSGRSQM